MKQRILRWSALLLAGMLCFSGCSVLREDNDISGIERAETMYVETGTETRTITPSLYYLESTSKLSVETRELTIGQEEDEAEAIVAALLESPNRSGLSRPASGMTIDKVEHTNDLINVYLYSAGAISQLRRFFVCATVTNTLTDYFGISYVCVFINHEPLTIGGYPYGAMRKISENVYEEYEQCLARYESRTDMEITLPIYFLNEEGTCLFPEMRTVTLRKSTDGFDPLQFAEELMEELAAGPEVNALLKTNFTQKSAETDAITVSYDDSIKTLKLEYNYAPMSDGTLSDTVSCAAVYRTLENIFPETVRMTISYRREFMSVSRAVARTLLGRTITLYFPDAEGNMLVPVSRVVNAGEVYQCKTYLRELLKGPTDSENASACFPEDYDPRDFHSVSIRGNTAYVDFGEAFVTAVSEMNEEEESLMFYAIVNTLCGIARVKQVLFTINGQVVEDAGGKICIAYPLMPNPGMLK